MWPGALYTYVANYVSCYCMCYWTNTANTIKYRLHCLFHLGILKWHRCIYVWDTNVPATMQNIHCIHHIFQRDVPLHRGMYIHICARYEVTSMNHVTRGSVHLLHKLQFVLLAYITEQACLPNYTYRSHCPHTVWVYRSDFGAHVPKYYQLQHLLHTILAYVPETNTFAKLHI